MTDYQPPLEDIRFTLETIGELDTWVNVPGFEEAGDDLVGAVLEEAAKLSRDVIAPTNWTGDQEGAVLAEAGVTAPEAFRPVFDAWKEGAWASLACDTDYGGQGLPGTLALAVSEMVTSANMAFSLCPMLSSGAIEAISAHADDGLKEIYLPRMISGEWTGAMNLTEPQAGSDVGAVKAKAEPLDDGSYKIKGQKIYITWGEHNMADNVVHLVLARTPGAPEGTKGISMFLVPRFHVQADGSLGEANDVRCVGLEEKLGIHASPTCVMAFGEHDNCIGYLVGEENKGMRNMFTMMNHARVSVGLEGTALLERAYQKAVTYATDRVQSARIDDPARAPARIIEHADVRRLLLTARAYAEASRAIIYRNAWALDKSHNLADPQARLAANGEADLLTPISKGWTTDVAVHGVSEALQVFGGMGFIEETGIAQLYRDIRIAPIYEGTNGIQALDLAGRKLRMDGGAHWRALIAEMAGFIGDMDDTDAQKGILAQAVADLSDVAENLFEKGPNAITDVAAGATPYMHLWGTILGGYLLLVQKKAALARIDAGEGNVDYLRAKTLVADFYISHILPQWRGYRDAVLAGAGSVLAMDEAAFARA